MIDSNFAVTFADDWLDAWNRHDLDAVLRHYAEDFRFWSPLIASIAGQADGVLCGKVAVRAYWEKGLARVPDLRFELHDVLLGADSLTLYYRGHAGMVAETFWFDVSGLVKQACACYAVQRDSSAD